MEVSNVLTIANQDILDLIAKRRDIYIKDPLLIVEHFNNENKIIDEYNGRQLLEMIQNANDESDTAKPKKVKITLENNTLLIANNGNPFSIGGVESLIYSDLSPKVMEENKVGQKGLGFRSVLNWSEEIYIASYDLHLKFSKQHARTFLEGLIDENPEIQTVLKRKTKKSFSISVLRCPYLEEDNNHKKEIDYDTVIELSLKEGIGQDIKNQIDKDIIPEILIFLNKLEEIEVQTDEHHFLLKKEAKDNGILITKTDFLDEQNNDSCLWFTSEEKGKLTNNEVTKNYELKIAYNPNTKPSIQKLFSYFRTDVDFPYPVLAHGSFELTGNRNQLIEDENGFNKMLLDKLAKLLVDCSIKLTKENKCNYDALKLIIPSITNNSSLNNAPWNFNKAIEVSISDTPIFPSINNKYLKLSENIKFYELPIKNSIPKKAYLHFTSLLQATSDKEIIYYLSTLKINLKYPDSEFTNKINQIIDNDFLTEKQRIDWIYLVCEKTKEIYSGKSPTLPFLLINSEDKRIKSFDTVIVPPKEVTYKLPKGIKLQFLNQDLYRRIRSRFGNIPPRQVIEKLNLYNVAEYAMNVVVQKIISSTNEIIRIGKKDKVNAIAEMHRALFSIYNSLDDNTDTKNTFPVTLTSPYLFTRNNELKEANKLYFGKEYALGYLMEDLLNEVKEDVFVGSLEQNGLIGGRPESEDLMSNYSVEKYLKWLGIADFPKKIKKEITSYRYKDDSYIRNIISSIKYPFTTPTFNDVIVNLEEMKTCWNFRSNVLWYEHFEEIVNGASFEILLTWFLKDNELYSSIIRNQENPQSNFTFEYPKKQYLRNIPHIHHKSFIYYFLQKKEFIPVENGEKSRPSNCLLDSNNLSPLVKTPKINYTAASFIKNNIDEEQIDYFLKRIGLKDSLKDLTIQSLYSLLNQHNTHFSEATSNIQSFYMAIIEATKNREVIEDSIERKKYFETGNIYAYFEGKNSFAPINEVTYVDNPNFSQELLKKLKIAKLPHRAGNQRIYSLFGVQPLDYIKFNVQKNIESNHKLNEAFVGELNEMKPHLFAYRFQKGLKKTQLDFELSAIKNIKIIIAFNIDVKYRLNGVDNDLALNKYEYIQDDVSKIFYIKLDRDNSNYQELKKDYRLKETIADIICGALKVTENRKDFILLLGESPSNWIHLLKREFEDYETIEKEIIGKFEGVLSSEQRFWKLILDIKEIKFKSEIDLNSDFIHSKLFVKLGKDEFFEIFRKLDYNNLSDRKNFLYIQKIFKYIKIDLSDFNAFSYKILNFESYLDNQLYTYHKVFSEKYASFLYNKKQSNGFIEKCEQVAKFNSFTVSNSINFEIKKAHKLAISKSFAGINYPAIEDILKIDLEAIYNKNIKALESDLRLLPNFNDTIFNDNKYDTAFKNAVFFNEVENLKIDLIQKFNTLTRDEGELQINIANTSVAFSDNNVNDLLDFIEEQVKNNDFKMEHYDPTKAPEANNNGKGNSSTGQSFNGKSKKYKNEDIGFIGEKFAFELLKKEFDSVEWVSEYAIKAGFPNGKDGLGYDFECKKGEETRFVEVKSSVTKNYSFNISTNEVKIGHSKEKSFDILLITNLLSEDINFKYLKNIFNYTNNESFLENTKFLVENDSYKIKFK
ncbi:DUF3883 domain-containing protein [Flavobacterium psychrophilum]|uniref:sacsin N-terminal ATP-binding-like domain-containing protein n=1 Tax=Flavobacterium psychrophilum TaxID=96345 RepID=UPI0004F6425C|nr:DUF3883 domain-containing protein [Flavobacterium psychrophilum]AIN75148.1 hypothetical protein FPG3_06830 [Flavobacterium psychrophilum FPG3]EKT2070397.1 DUF3883 domain-containing protein [Flavobacterium psychrophilum]EKT2072757.1 DUF3883 domain-containing protein [Flavobacterium psychrophilum]EKT4492210.1 DUF3883 domain-containing protein [Flavobacterium psychrophilum]MBF2045010.1 DUF3883 domain-containing protein [Flavobacterium psychrophilum]